MKKAGKKSCTWVIEMQQGIRKQNAVDRKAGKERMAQGL